MEEKKQFEFLNTLRFISVLWIVFTHFNYQCFSNYYSQNILENYCYHNTSWLYWIFYGITGKYAVSMMCIISGWLVAKKFYRKSVDFGKFIFNRYIRLILPVLVVCSIYIIIKIVLGDRISISKYLNGVLWLGNNGINVHLEYIIDFFIGNVLVALFEYLFSNRKNSFIIYIPLIIILYYMEKIWILSGVIGGLTYHICEIFKEKKTYKYWYLLFIIPIVWWLPRGEETNKIYLRDSIASSIILITIYCLPKLQNIFNWNKLKEIKKISYSLFVIHGLVNNFFGTYILSYIKKISVINNVYILQLLLFVFVLIIDLIISSIIYYVAENKIYNLLNNFFLIRINNYKIELVKYEEHEGEKNEK